MPAAPSVGRVVHYVAYGTPGGEFPSGVCRAAIITEAQPPTVVLDPQARARVDLCVVNPSGVVFNRDVPYDAQHAPGSWHWPEREPESPGQSDR